MNTPIKLAAYAGGLAVIFAAALGLGAATGNPIDMSNTHDTTTHGGHAEAGTAVTTAPPPRAFRSPSRATPCPRSPPRGSG
ncbi:hypothetical protein BTZ20_4622 [Rhodococcus sp. MTM3W5.2]|nr:hypothetical protein [Rhodococcus sp. MTM3W5.2]AQA25881.1 hypothetical protein BTZ20_4622 [Rhodococcus sp. MTM3W5.2]